MSKNAINPFPSVSNQDQHSQERPQEPLQVAQRAQSNISAMQMELYPIQEEDPRDMMLASFTGPISQQQKIKQR
jgi:hypothetical protein